MRDRVALLLSGGIGDYLHYLVRLPSLCERNGLDRNNLVVFVESTVPAAVTPLFRLTLNEFDVQFIPAAWHWTKTNPLLVPVDEHQRVNRPAYQYVLGLGFARLIDWFLPFLCHTHPSDERVLQPLLTGRSPLGPNTVLVAARDKGAIWWPSEPAGAAVHQRFAPRHEVVYTGTENERLPWMSSWWTAPDVATALVASMHAELFVGTDTGLATVRELLGRPNLYCVTPFWFDELMVRYNYITADMISRSGSKVAKSHGELETLLDAFNS
jgi:hypothetical protein